VSAVSGGVLSTSHNITFRQVDTFEKGALQKSLNAKNVIFHHPYFHSIHSQDISQFFHVNVNFELKSNYTGTFSYLYFSELDEYYHFVTYWGRCIFI